MTLFTLTVDIPADYLDEIFSKDIEVSRNALAKYVDVSALRSLLEGDIVQLLLDTNEGLRKDNDLLREINRNQLAALYSYSKFLFQSDQVHKMGQREQLIREADLNG